MATASEVKVRVDTTNLRIIGRADEMFALLHRIAYGPTPEPAWVKTQARRIVEEVLGHWSSDSEVAEHEES